jgi:hypothetical protein
MMSVAVFASLHALMYECVVSDDDCVPPNLYHPARSALTDSARPCDQQHEMPLFSESIVLG